MHEQLEIRTRMSAVRSRGLVNANQLAEQVEKLSDWREHVRAHPLPIALAVAGLAYWAVPSRGSKQVDRTERVEAGTTSSQALKESDRDAASAKVAKASGLAGAALGFVGSLVGNAVRSYVSEQVQTLITSRGDHAASQQRPAPYARY